MIRLEKLVNSVKKNMRKAKVIGLAAPLVFACFVGAGKAKAEESTLYSKLQPYLGAKNLPRQEYFLKEATSFDKDNPEHFKLYYIRGSVCRLTYTFEECGPYYWIKEYPHTILLNKDVYSDPNQDGINGNEIFIGKLE